jgi:hypothetical protein
LAIVAHFADVLPMARWVEMALSLAWHRVLAAKHALLWVSHHTGVPALLVLAIAIVAAWRLGRRSIRFALEVGVVLLVLVFLTGLGILKF